MSAWLDVYTVVDGDDKRDDYWLKIGRCIPSRKGDGGYTILLNALPLNNRLIIRPRKPRRTEDTGVDFDDATSNNDLDY